ncbi:macrophage mannose receptor 1-like [Elysia marginata]|uniref:Macrophage mannose receptor 1-like n=1 Tax=Elysia marginata TaxID=1093978 RepID=A0AAV4FUM5_9GAST|nr:macrophage mannose receptor 1-like [Elysia marginata]
MPSRSSGLEIHSSPGVCILASCRSVTCKTGWTPNPYSGSCVKIFRDKKSWDGARSSCQKEGADLIKIIGSKINTFLSGHITPDLKTVYIGLRMINYKLHWLDESIEALYNNEQKLQPSRAQESCGQINKDGYWIFTDCASVHSYYCEKSEDLCPDEWLPSYASGTCIKIHKQQTTWSIARHRCNTQGGDLVMIMNADMNVFVHGNVDGPECKKRQTPF